MLYNYKDCIIDQALWFFAFALVPLYGHNHMHKHQVNICLRHTSQDK